MKAKTYYIILAGICVILLAAPQARALERQDFSMVPTTNDGAPWRVAYIEGGPYSNYYNYLYATIQGLMDLGWIKDTPIPRDDLERTTQLWSWLCKEADSPYIQFLDDAYYTANWDKEARVSVAEKLIRRLNDHRKIDLVIAMGSWAGKDLANDRHRTPTVIMSTSDPVGSGIIKSMED